MNEDMNCYYNWPNQFKGLCKICNILMSFNEYYYFDKYKNDTKYHKITTEKGIIEQLKKSNTIEYLVEIILNDCMVWEIREYTLEEKDLRWMETRRRIHEGGK